MKPTARISLDGKDITTRLFGSNGQGGPLSSLTVTDEAGVKSDTVELEIDNREGFTAPPVGSELQVWLGYEPEPVYMGRYKVESWRKRGPRETLTVSAKAAELTKEIKATKTRSHHDTTVGAIVRRVAQDHELGVSIDASLASRVVPHIDQQTESDLGFLSRLAKRNGATFKLADGKVVFTRKGSKKLPSGNDKPAITLTPVGLTDWDAGSSERGDHRSVKCGYMDPSTRKRVYVTSGSGKPCHRDKRLYGSKAEAEAAASATLGDLKRGKKEAELTGPGNPALFAESLVTLKGFDPDVDGEYLAKSVTHTLAGGGYTTSVSLETEGSGDGDADGDSEADPSE